MHLFFVNIYNKKYYRWQEKWIKCCSQRCSQRRGVKRIYSW